MSILDSIIIAIQSLGGRLPFLWVPGDIVLIMSVVIFLVIMCVRVRKVNHMIIQVRRREQELIEDNNKLYRMSRMNAEFFQNMSHDLKAPLAAISTSVLNVRDMFDFGNINQDEACKSLDNAQREIMRMTRMIDDAIKPSLQNDGWQDRKPLDIAQLLRKDAEVCRPLVERQGNILALYIPNTLPYILGNADMITQVLSNLLSNANRYTRDGEIAIIAAQKDDTVVVTVSDDGLGVKPELLPHVFERGVSDSGGTGLGLTICKVIVEEVHGGKILIESAYGKGTKVRFTLPVCSAPEV